MSDFKKFLSAAVIQLNRKEMQLKKVNETQLQQPKATGFIEKALYTSYFPFIVLKYFLKAKKKNVSAQTSISKTAENIWN